MSDAAKVRSFPLSRLKFAARLRHVADGLAAPGIPDGGDVFLLQVDRDGIIHTESLMGQTHDRVLRMVGLLETAQHHLMETLAACECCQEESEDHDA